MLVFVSTICNNNKSMRTTNFVLVKISHVYFFVQGIALP
jgi:hypothetical protein